MPLQQGQSFRLIFAAGQVCSVWEDRVEIGIPQYFLDPDNASLLVAPGVVSENTPLEKVRELSLPVFQIDDRSVLPWADQALLDTLTPLQPRQIIIWAYTVELYETGLVLMCLEIGFQVYLALPEDRGTDLSVQRLRQATAVILTHEGLIEELRVHAG